MLSLLKSIKKRDPAANNYLEVIFFYPGLHALLIYKLANILWKLKLTFFAKTICCAKHDQPVFCSKNFANLDFKKAGISQDF